MHQQVAHPPGPDGRTGLIENVTDSLVNAFSRVRKPDERFLSMREGVDKFEEGLALSERLWARIRSRSNGEFLSCASNGVVRLSAYVETATRPRAKILLRTTMTLLLLCKDWASSSRGSRTR